MSLDLLSRETMEAMMAFMRTHAAWGAPILFAVMVLEGIIATTFIFSGSLMIVAAGALIQAGVLGYAGVFAAIFGGFWLGDWINFEIGRRGEHWFRNLSVVTSRPALMARAQALIDRHGWAAIFLSRFMGPLRPFVTLLAGACRMPHQPFHIATVVSSILVTAGLLNAGMAGVQLFDKWK
jgi:membrane protein DedA with SNARE-associated domain